MTKTYITERDGFYQAIQDGDIKWGDYVLTSNLTWWKKDPFAFKLEDSPHRVLYTALIRKDRKPGRPGGWSYIEFAHQLKNKDRLSPYYGHIVADSELSLNFEEKRLSWTTAAIEPKGPGWLRPDNIPALVEKRGTPTMFLMLVHALKALPRLLKQGQDIRSFKLSNLVNIDTVVELEIRGNHWLSENPNHSIIPQAALNKIASQLAIVRLAESALGFNGYRVRAVEIENAKFPNVRVPREGEPEWATNGAKIYNMIKQDRKTSEARRQQLLEITKEAGIDENATPNIWFNIVLELERTSDVS